MDAVRQATADYLNAQLDRFQLGKLRRCQVESRLMLVLACMTKTHAREVTYNRMRFDVVNRQVVAVDSKGSK